MAAEPAPSPQLTPLAAMCAYAALVYAGKQAQLPTATVRGRRYNLKALGPLASEFAVCDNSGGSYIRWAVTTTTGDFGLVGSTCGGVRRITRTLPGPFKSVPEFVVALVRASSSMMLEATEPRRSGRGR